jgi:hypothetical protein
MDPKLHLQYKYNYPPSGTGPTPPPALAEMFYQAKQLRYSQYLAWVKAYFRVLNQLTPDACVILLTEWGKTEFGDTARSALLLWLGELLALTHPEETPASIAARAGVARVAEPAQMWRYVSSIAGELWPNLRKDQPQKRATDWLAEHVASHIWVSFWLDRKVWSHGMPTAHELRIPDTKARMKTMHSDEAARDAQLERVFGRGVFEALPGYDPDHPVATKTKIEQPTELGNWYCEALLVGTLLPVAVHNGWRTVDLLHCLIWMQLAGLPKFNLEDAAADSITGRVAGCRYVNRKLLHPMGVKSLLSQGRPPIFAAGYPRGFGIGTLVADYLRSATSRQARG